MRRGGGDLTVRTVQQALPPRTAIVYYVSLRQSLLIWTITADAARVRHRRSPRRASRAASRLPQLLQAGRPGDEGRQLSEALYDEIVRPAVEDLADGNTLVMIPDGALHALPFRR